METTEIPVLIIGGSMVGLAAALFLNAHGIATLNVERHAGTAIHPRAGHFHLRTLELLRQVGVEQAAIDASVEQFGTGGGINAVESLAGKEIAHYISDLNEGVAALSPSRRMFLSQQRLEPLLRHRAEELGATLNYGSELVSFEQDANGVSAIIRDLATNEERMVRAAYMIAADGNRSPIRERLGIGMTGPGHLSDSITIYFNADLRPYLRGRDLGVIYVFNADQRGFFRLEKDATSGFLVVSTFGDTSRPGARDVATGITRQACVALLRSAVGVPDLAVQIIDVAAWKAVAHTADRYAAGRVFLVGDAAHVMPPAGGFGGNTGIHDAHNLAWKLAAVLRGHAAPALLDTYESERRPIGMLTVGQAYTRWVRRVDPELGVAEAPPVVDDMTMEIGYLYGVGALYADPRHHPVPVGARAPHLTLLRDGLTVSSLDLLGTGFVLLAGVGGRCWVDAAEQAAADLRVPLAAHCLSASGLIDVEGRFAAVYGTDDAGAVLIRPDGFMVWRSGDERPSKETLRHELGKILQRIPPSKSIGSACRSRSASTSSPDASDGRCGGLGSAASRRRST